MSIRQFLVRAVLAYAGLPYHPGKWRIISVALRRLPELESFEGTVRRGPFVWTVDCAHNETDRYIALLGAYEIYELRAVSRHIPRNGCVLDVGGNVGYHALWFGSMVGPGGTVHTFEPFPETFQRLTGHIEANHMPWVHAWQLAACDRDGWAVGEAEGGQQAAHLRPGSETEGGVRMQTVRLDTFAQEHSLQSVAVMKVDVEGAEIQVLDGAVELLLRFRPVLMVEVNPLTLERFGVSAADLVRRILALGYDPNVATRRGLVPCAAEQFTTPDAFARLAATHGRERSVNLICLPRSA